jgi:hypothetical protein
MTEPGDAAAPRTCPWCSAPATAEDAKCHACGAALAQRESIAGLVIPGVTTVDPALQAYDAQPLHVRGPSPTQGLAGGSILAAVAGGPAGLAALGGVAALAAVEYLSNRLDGHGRVDVASVGKPSEAALIALERIEREGQAAMPGSDERTSGSEPAAPDGA